ncbi:serine hydrolase [Virgibacillus ainsalahensis]
MKLLSENVKGLMNNAGGTWGIALEDFDTRESWQYNGDELFYAASVIKIPIMIAAYRGFENREFALSDSLELRREELVGGSGVLQHMTPGTLLSIYDLVTLMIIQSDNTATNMLIDFIGINHIQQTMQEIGLEDSKLYHKLMTVPADRKGDNIITASEMTGMLKKMVTGKIISFHACEEMINIMKKQQLQDGLPKKLPPDDREIPGANNEWQIANKTGYIPGVRHDIGIFYVKKRVLIASILAKGVDDRKSAEVLNAIGLEIYNYLKIG